MGGGCSDILVTQELLMLTVMKPGSGEIVFCFHCPFFSSKVVQVKGGSELIGVAMSVL